MFLYVKLVSSSKSVKAATIAAMKDDLHIIMHELQDAFASSNCALCVVAQRAVDRYIGSLAHEGFVTNVGERATIRDARGFCAVHSHMLSAGRNALGLAIIHHDVLKQLRLDLENMPSTQNRGPSLLQRALGQAQRSLSLFQGQQPCSVCVRVRDTSRRYAEALIVGLHGELQNRLRASVGLCVPHLRLTLSLAPAQEAQLLREIQLGIWDTLLAELDEFTRKQDHRFQHESSGKEADSWRRALRLVAGEAGTTYEG